jgi:hypothetical protein
MHLQACSREEVQLHVDGIPCVLTLAHELALVEASSSPSHRRVRSLMRRRLCRSPRATSSSSSLPVEPHLTAASI